MNNVVKLLSSFIFTFIVTLSSYNVVNAQSYRTINGYGNNINNPDFGKKDALQLDIVRNAFGDSISSLSEAVRPNARYISNFLCDQKEVIYNNQKLTDFVWAFGEFVSHDIFSTTVDKYEPIHISIPKGDDFFEEGSYIDVFRTKAAEGTGTSTDNPRRYSNECTSFIDASNIYGSDSTDAAWLRTFTDGKLKTSEGDFLPWNTISREFNDRVDNNCPKEISNRRTNDKLFVSGDIRCNENPLLLTINTVFLREHNRLCDEILKKNPNLSDEEVYQNARKMVGAYLQTIVYYEWLPVQGIQLPEYKGYNPDINPGVSNLFSAAGFSLRHSFMSDTIRRLDERGDEEKYKDIEFKDAYFNPVIVELFGEIEAFILGMDAHVQQKLDLKMISNFRNFTLGNEVTKNIDFATENIMRSRERGIPDYNSIREDIGLNKITEFDEISTDQELNSKLKFLYGNVDNIDAWVGFLAEDQLPNSIYGETMTKIITEQFLRLRDGDRFYFENDTDFSQEEINEIKNTRLRDIILRNTDIERLKYNVFTLNDDEKINGLDITHTNLNAISYPNPVKRKLNTKIWVEKEGDLTITLTNTLGKKLLQRTQWVYKGENILEKIDFYHLRNGTYFVLLEFDDSYRVVKVVKDE